MKLIEIAARAYNEREQKYIADWLTAFANHRPLLTKDRTMKIWYWALKRWGGKWPDADYTERVRRESPTPQQN